MTTAYLNIEKIESYTISFELSNYVWDIVVKWDNFAKLSIGSQFVNASDSISANIAEGFGRYHKKDKIKFYHYSQGSTSESKDWNTKAEKRELVKYNFIWASLEKLPKSINHLIKYTNEKLTM